MQLQAVGANALLPTFGNPIGTIGALSVALLAINAVANLPGAKAQEEGFPWRDYCEISCTPLTGEQTATRQICIETCLIGKETIKTTTEQVLKNGKWEVVKELGKVVGPALGYVDCTNLCNPTVGGPRVVYDFVKASWKVVWEKDNEGAVEDAIRGTARAACLAILATPAGYPGCLSCCAGTKYVGVN